MTVYMARLTVSRVTAVSNARRVPVAAVIQPTGTGTVTVALAVTHAMDATMVRGEAAAAAAIPQSERCSTRGGERRPVRLQTVWAGKKAAWAEAAGGGGGGTDS
jgi:hypothetical protein